MRITIEAECRRGLRIIEEIPDIPLCKIEGYNGIGKTNAIKLLRMCTGDQPFKADDPSWRTFRDQLVRARVRATGLQDFGDVEWKIEEERDWPDSAEPLGDRLGSVRIDGRGARLRDVAPVLRVHHVIAAETPLHILAGRVDAVRTQISTWEERHGNQRLIEIDDALKKIQTLVEECLPSQVRLDLAAALEAEKIAERLNAQLGEARRHAQLLQEAVEVADRLDQVRGRGPDMDLKLRNLQDELDQIDTQKEDLDRRIADASAQQHRDEQAEREFMRAQKHLIRQDRALQEVNGMLEQLAAAAEVAPQREQVEAERGKVGRKLDSLTELLPRVHDTPLIVAVLRDLIRRLEEAEEVDLGDKTLLDADDEWSGWTVIGLKDACLRQIAVLAERSPSTTAEQLAAAVEEARARLDVLAQTASALDQVEQAQTKHVQAEVRLRQAVSGLPEQAARSLDDLMQARTALDQKSRILLTQHAQLRHTRELLGGGMTEDTLAAELVRLCREASVDAPRVRGRLEGKHAELEELVRQEMQGTQQAERARRIADQEAAHVAHVVDQLSIDDDLEWLRRVVPELPSLAARELQEQVTVLERLGARVENARDTLQRTYASVQGIRGALSSLADQLRDPGLKGRDTAWNTAGRLWLAEEVRGWFGHELVRKALFRGGENIQLDPREMTVSWTKEGVTYERPLSAFSSGEQAFAYTQAQVAQLEDEDAAVANRLIVLDEFNAFIDSQRMEDLARYLVDRRSRIPHDQVVVILPLETLPQGSADATGATGARIRELEGRGYFAEAFQL